MTMKKAFEDLCFAIDQADESGLLGYLMKVHGETVVHNFVDMLANTNSNVVEEADDKKVSER